jgi:hypothetical protein
MYQVRGFFPHYFFSCHFLVILEIAIDTTSEWQKAKGKKVEKKNRAFLQN